MEGKQNGSSSLEGETSKEVEESLEVKFISHAKAKKLQAKAREEYKIAFDILKDM